VTARSASLAFGTLLAVTLLAAPLPRAAGDAPAPAPPAPGSPIPWASILPEIKTVLYVVREGPHQWGITAETGELPDAEPGKTLRLTAVEAMTEAHSDIVWITGEVLNHRLFVSQPMETGEKLKPLDAYVNALADNATFADPLRRFADGILRSKGMVCSDCLSGLSPTRDVTWSQVRPYLEDLIHVEEVTGQGRIDLHVGTMTNRLPSFQLSFHNLAAAAYATIARAKEGSPEFLQAIQENLNEELTASTEGSPIAIRTALNQRLPRRILEDPRCLGPIVEHLGESLERHSLRCLDCPRRK